MLDTVWVIRVERLERQYLAERQAFATAALMSPDSDAKFPTWESYLADDFAALCQPPGKPYELGVA